MKAISDSTTKKQSPIKVCTVYLISGSHPFHFSSVKAR